MTAWLFSLVLILYSWKHAYKPNMKWGRYGIIVMWSYFVCGRFPVSFAGNHLNFLCTGMYMCTCTCTHACMRVHTHTHTLIHSLTHSHTHTHKHTSILKGLPFRNVCVCVQFCVKHLVNCKQDLFLLLYLLFHPEKIKLYDYA